MRIVGEAEIVKFVRKHPDSRNWLDGWLSAAKKADWRTIQDVKEDYPAADGGVKVSSGSRVTVFDVGGNKYRMVVNISFVVGTIDILELLSHSEYSEDLWKRRY